MKELTAKLVLKNLNERKLETGDYNDILNYVELMLANEDEVLEQLNDRNWRVSSKFNARTVYIREVGFLDAEYDEDENGNEIYVERKFVHTYIIDGNGNKRICTYGNEEKFVDVPYNHRSYDEIMEIAENLRQEAKEVLGTNEEYILSTFTKEDLKEKSEKCYYYEESKYDTVYIPKTVVAFNEKGQVLLATWFAKKHEEYIAEVTEETTEVAEDKEEVKEYIVECVEIEEKAKKVGNLWNNKEIEIYEINNKKIVLDGWNGEAFTECWEVSDNDGLQLVNEQEKYTVKPVYECYYNKISETEEVELIDYEIE